PLLVGENEGSDRRPDQLCAPAARAGYHEWARKVRRAGRSYGFHCLEWRSELQFTDSQSETGIVALQWNFVHRLWLERLRSVCPWMDPGLQPNYSATDRGVEWISEPGVWSIGLAE